MTLSKESENGAPLCCSVDGDRVVIVWKEKRGQAASLMAVPSRGGQTLSAPRELATASCSADNPTLVVTPRGLRVSWFSADTVHRLLLIEEAASYPGGL